VLAIAKNKCSHPVLMYCAMLCGFSLTSFNISFILWQVLYFDAMLLQGIFPGNVTGHSLNQGFRKVQGD